MSPSRVANSVFDPNTLAVHLGCVGAVLVYLVFLGDSEVELLRLFSEHENELVHRGEHFGLSADADATILVPNVPSEQFKTAA